jgi:hypothetical protein
MINEHSGQFLNLATSRHVGSYENPVLICGQGVLFYGTKYLYSYF